MSVDTLLSRLEGVKKTSYGKYKAICPAHEDRTPSLTVGETPDGWLLVHCFAGCETADVLSRVGLTFSDLYPARPLTQHSYPPVRRPWIPSDVFELARREIMVIALIGCHVHAHKAIPEDDYQRLFVAVERLNDIGRAAYGK